MQYGIAVRVQNERQYLEALYGESGFEEVQGSYVNERQDPEAVYSKGSHEEVREGLREQKGSIWRRCIAKEAFWRCTRDYVNERQYLEMLYSESGLEEVCEADRDDARDGFPGHHLALDALLAVPQHQPYGGLQVGSRVHVLYRTPRTHQLKAVPQPMAASRSSPCGATLVMYIKSKPIYITKAVILPYIHKVRRWAS